MSDTMSEPEVNSYPPMGTPMNPADHPDTNFQSGSIRMQGIKDEIGAFRRTFNNAKKVTGQN
jgi:hypothetical protein